MLDYGCPADYARGTARLLSDTHQVADEIAVSALCGQRNWTIRTDIEAEYIDEEKGGPAHRSENVTETTKRLADWAKLEAEKAR